MIAHRPPLARGTLGIQTRDKDDVNGEVAILRKIAGLSIGAGARPILETVYAQAQINA